MAAGSSEEFPFELTLKRHALGSYASMLPRVRAFVGAGLDNVLISSTAVRVRRTISGGTYHELASLDGLVAGRSHTQEVTLGAGSGPAVFYLD